MSTNLSSEDFAILLALESNPYMPMTELAALLGVSRITAKKRVDDLKERDIIRKPIAIYNPNSLFLKRVNVFAKLKTVEQLQKLELVCDEHPYTHYRVRAFGGGFGLFIQFDIPESSVKLLNDFFKTLQKERILESFTLLPSTNLRTDVYADLKRYNVKLSSWEFSWKEWLKSTESFSSALPTKSNKTVNYSEFNQIHFKILRMLTADGSLKQTDINEKLTLSRTQGHRDYNYVMDNYIEKIRFIYNREIFQLTETYIAFGQNIPQNTSAKIFNAINKSPPPFRLSLDIIEEEGILVWANMSSSQAADFAFALWNKFNNIQIYTLDTKKSKLYWFYPNNFDFTTQVWKTSKDYFITEPLERTLKQ